VPVPLHKAIWEAIGVSPVGIAYGEVYTSLQTHVIDAVEINASSVNGENLWEPAKHYTLTGHYFVGLFVGNVLPSTIGGDVVRVTRSSGTAGSSTVAFASVVLERLTGFVGLRGEHAVKLRNELHHVIRLHLYERLHGTLHRAGADAATSARPITNRLQGEGWRGNRALWGSVPYAASCWVRINEAMPGQVLAALNYLRSVLATWNARRPEAEQLAGRMVSTSNMPTAAEYAVALHTADMLAFTGAKLDMLYAGIMHSMPVYRLYPATPEREAIELWWPWGRPPPLVDGGPAPLRPRKAVLDPNIITGTRPQGVVREVMERTGINRTTAQRLTAPMRIGMRLTRQRKAEALLRQGVTKAEVARSVGLSPSRISAMFKGQTFPTKKALSNSDPMDSDCGDEGEDPSSESDNDV